MGPSAAGPRYWSLSLVSKRSSDARSAADSSGLVSSAQCFSTRAAAACELLARLEAEGLIRGGAQVDLTAEGETLHRGLREYVTGPTARLLSQFDIHDIETTVRTLQAITRRAAEHSSSPAD